MKKEQIKITITPRIKKILRGAGKVQYLRIDIDDSFSMIPLTNLKINRGKINKSIKKFIDNNEKT